MPLEQPYKFHENKRQKMFWLQMYLHNAFFFLLFNFIKAKDQMLHWTIKEMILFSLL